MRTAAGNVKMAAIDICRLSHDHTAQLKGHRYTGRSELIPVDVPTTTVAYLRVGHALEAAETLAHVSRHRHHLLGAAEVEQGARQSVGHEHRLQLVLGVVELRGELLLVLLGDRLHLSVQAISVVTYLQNTMSLVETSWCKCFAYLENTRRICTRVETSRQ